MVEKDAKNTVILQVFRRYRENPVKCIRAHAKLENLSRGKLRFAVQLVNEMKLNKGIKIKITLE